MGQFFSNIQVSQLHVFYHTRCSRYRHGSPSWICCSTRPESAHDDGENSLDAHSSFYSQLPSWTGISHTGACTFPPSLVTTIHLRSHLNLWKAKKASSYVTAMWVAAFGLLSDAFSHVIDACLSVEMPTGCSTSWSTLLINEMLNSWSHKAIRHPPCFWRHCLWAVIWFSKVHMTKCL